MSGKGISSLPSCPFPTTLECNCFFGMAASGFAATNTSTFASVMDDNTLQRYHLTGEWRGVNTISEYMDFYGGDFASPLESLVPLILDFSDSTIDECVMYSTGVARVKSAANFSVGGVSQCFDLVGGNAFKYQLTGDLAQPILVTNWDVWVPDDFIPALFSAIDSPATSEFLCDVIVDACADDFYIPYDDYYVVYDEEIPTAAENRADEEGGTDNGDNTAGLRGPSPDDPRLAKKKAMKKCMKQLAALPPNDNGFWIDGDSRHCRILHGGYAATNSVHCPHVSFEKEMDANGFFKCYQSKGTTANDHFTPAQLAFFQLATLPYPSNDPFFAAYPAGNCPDLN